MVRAGVTLCDRGGGGVKIGQKKRYVIVERPLDPHQSFHIFRDDRANRTGGGVCALIPKSIRCSEHVLNANERELILKTGSELICIDAQLGQSKFRFILVYRPPACSITQAELTAKTSNLKSLLSCLIHPSCNSIILGDFNLPKIKWSTLEYPLDGVHDILFELFLVQVSPNLLLIQFTFQILLTAIL